MNTIVGKRLANKLGEDIGEVIASFSGNKRFSKSNNDWRTFDFDTTTKLDKLAVYLFIEFGTNFDLGIRVLATHGK